MPSPFVTDSLPGLIGFKLVIVFTEHFKHAHMGLGTVALDPSSPDWDLDILDHLVPGLKSP